MCPLWCWGTGDNSCLEVVGVAHILAADGYFICLNDGRIPLVRMDIQHLIYIMISIWRNDCITHKSSVRAMDRPCTVGLIWFFSFTLDAVNTFRSVVGFGDKNREANRTSYTRALPYLFVGAFSLSEYLLKPLSACSFQQLPKWAFSCTGLEGMRKIQLELRSLLSASWSGPSSNIRQDTLYFMKIWFLEEFVTQQRISDMQNL
jgi:hypothetical protein